MTKVIYSGERNYHSIASSASAPQISPDNKYIASSLYHGGINIWDFNNERLLNTPDELFDQKIDTFALSRDGQLLIIAEKDIQIWDMLKGTLVQAIDIDQGGTLKSAAKSGRKAVLSQNGKIISIGLFDSGWKSQIWDVSTWTPLRMVNGENLALSFDGKILAVHADNFISLIEVATGTLIQKIKKDATIESASFSPNGEYFVVGFDDNKAVVWEFKRKLKVKFYLDNPDHNRVKSVVFSQKGDVLATVTHWNVRFWDIATGNLLHSYITKTNIHTIAFLPNNNLLATGTPSGTFAVWIVEGQEV